MVVRLPALFRFAGPHRRPTYTAVCFAFLGLGNVIVPPVTGLLLDAQVLSFPTMFFICGVLAVTGWVLFFRVATPEAVRN